MATVRARSASPTEYRQISMADAHVYSDRIFDPPADIDELRRHIVGDAHDNASELNGIPAELEEQVRDIANDYLHQCRELARDAKGEFEWKSALLTGVFWPLVKLLAPDTLATSASDEPWRTELKPRAPLLRDLLPLPTPRLGAANLNLTGQASPTATSETATETSETAAASMIEDDDPSNPLTTPRPDIIVGLARNSFAEVHQMLLREWQDDGQLLSEPHRVQQGLHFLFLLVEAKGLTTSGNMMAAENQAAVGGACAINILQALQRLEPDSPLSPLVFSITTEGPLHQLSIHYATDGGFYMTVHRAWRATLQRDCVEFVVALARIVQWGQGQYRNQITASLERVVDRLRG